MTPDEFVSLLQNQRGNPTQIVIGVDQEQATITGPITLPRSTRTQSSVLIKKVVFEDFIDLTEITANGALQIEECVFKKDFDLLTRR
ncbi:MAG: hypothetical protein U0936_16890 [Planctomycetaceae bacterium]